MVDTTAPVISGESYVDTEVSQTGSYSMEPGVTASDNSTTALTKAESNTVDITTLGSYTDTTTFTDAAGNSASFTRVVGVVDTTAPTVTVLGEAVVLVINMEVILSQEQQLLIIPQDLLRRFLEPLM